MDLSQLQLKLEEIGLEPDKIDEVLASAEDWKVGGEVRDKVPVENLELMREYETDWRRKAIIAAEIIKRSL